MLYAIKPELFERIQLLKINCFSAENPLFSQLTHHVYAAK